MAKQQEIGEGFGIAALVLGIFAFVLGWYPIFGLIFVVPALVFGHLQQKAKKTSMATAGLVLGYIALGFNILWTIVGIVAYIMGL